MEQNKLDSSQIIGFLFLIGAFLWMFMFQPDFEEENKITNDNNDLLLQVCTISPLLVLSRAICPIYTLIP